MRAKIANFMREAGANWIFAANELDPLDEIEDLELGKLTMQARIKFRLENPCPECRGRGGWMIKDVPVLCLDCWGFGIDVEKLQEEIKNEKEKLELS